ncbi:MAG: glycosyltransferase [bacterium]|nr:glycosyltransferase [bacterium]
MNSKKKIIFCLPSAMVGGIENHLARQLRLFDPKRYEIAIVLLFTRSSIALEDIVPSYVRVYKFNFKHIYDIASIRKLWRLLRERSPDIVVTSAFDANALFRILQPFFGYVTIPRLHNLYPDQPFHLRIVDAVLALCTPTVVAVSQGVADYASKRTWIPRKKFTVIPNGIDLVETEQFRKEHSDVVALKKELGFGVNQRIVLNVSRLKPQKNLLLAIEAFAKFKKDVEGCEYTFVIVGEGGQREQLELRANELGVADSVVFTGLRRDTFKFYMIADMFLMTSIREGFPNVLLESMAFGVPFISTRVPGATEAIVDGVNGYLADSTPEGLSEKMVLLSSELKEHQERYSADCLRVAREYSMEVNVKRYEGVFSRILGKHGTFY